MFSLQYSSISLKEYVFIWSFNCIRTPPIFSLIYLITIVNDNLCVQKKKHYPLTAGNVSLLSCYFFKVIFALAVLFTAAYAIIDVTSPSENALNAVVDTTAAIPPSNENIVLSPFPYLYASIMFEQILSNTKPATIPPI